MVRFIIMQNNSFGWRLGLFTFQYGQIYYSMEKKHQTTHYIIYIPIWLDLLFYVFYQFYIRIQHLHSNMVRFIIFYPVACILHLYRFTFQYGQIYYVNLLIDCIITYKIYIPIWLDLLLYNYLINSSLLIYLHSNMVRFIIFIL